MTEPRTQEAPDKVAVAVLCGRLAISDFENWDPNEDDDFPQEIKLGFKTYEFDTDKEAAAFRKGVDEATGWQEVLHLSDLQAEAIREAIAANGAGFRP